MVLFVKTQASLPIKTCSNWSWSNGKANILLKITTIQIHTILVDHFLIISIHLLSFILVLIEHIVT